MERGFVRRVNVVQGGLRYKFRARQDILRNGSDDDVARILQTAIQMKPADHTDIIGTERGMSQIGG